MIFIILFIAVALALPVLVEIYRRDGDNIISRSGKEILEVLESRGVIKTAFSFHSQDEAADLTAKATSTTNAAVRKEYSSRAETPEAAANNPVRILNLRNPKTGEVAPFPNTYRFAKKWVKEMMVAEGLLSRVYTTSELGKPKISQKVKEAIEHLKTLEKYNT
jgi:hypothetical protein